MPCAIEPASTEAGVTNDFGYHALGLPASIDATTPVYVHLVGSFGDPAKPDDQSFPNQLLLDELTKLGMVVLMVAHDNEPTVGSLCKQVLDCYEPVRKEIIYGIDAPAPYSALKDVSPPNDIVSRWTALSKTIQGAGLLGDSPPSMEVAGLRIGGHSQGGGHAALFAKEHAVARLCTFSSPTDGGATGPAPWIAGTWATNVSFWRGLVHEGDPGFLKIQANYTAGGLVEGDGWTRLTFATSDPHAATVKDAEAEAARAACVN